MMIWLSFFNVVLLLLVGLLMAFKKRATQKMMYSIISMIKQKAFMDKGIIVCLAYHSDLHKNVCELIDQVSSEKLVIIYDAPEWLFVNKQRRWAAHMVISSASISYVSEESKVIRFDHEKYSIIDEPVEYLNYQLLRLSKEGTM